MQIKPPIKSAKNEAIKEAGRVFILGLVALVLSTLIDLFTQLETKVWLVPILTILLRALEKYQHTNGGTELPF